MILMSINALKRGILDLAPEIFPLIASYIPLYSTPSTVFALALTNRRISGIVIPILHSCIILKNETDAREFIQKVVKGYPRLRNGIRELHIMSGLSEDTRNQIPAWDVVRQVQDVISRGYLPFIHTLGVYLTGWEYGTGRFGIVSKDFWAQLKENCPRLRAIILKGFLGTVDTWFVESGILQISGIENLSIDFHKFLATMPPREEHFSKYIKSLAPSLQTLNLHPRNPNDMYIEPLFELDLPSLRSLTLVNFSQMDVERIRSFFVRHPKVEYLNIASHIGLDQCWFLYELPEVFLPNLRHLVAQKSDVRLLTKSILHQLVTLSVTRLVSTELLSYSSFIAKNALPNLRSLVLNHKTPHVPPGSTVPTEEESRSMLDGYLGSIARAAPNIEELGILDNTFELESAFDGLRHFSCLEDLYHGECPKYRRVTISAERERTFRLVVAHVVKALPYLKSVTDLGTQLPPYLSATIGRESGNVIFRRGYGMKIGREDEPFPSGQLD